jgi:hypothetical protein
MRTIQGVQDHKHFTRDTNGHSLHMSSAEFHDAEGEMHMRFSRKAGLGSRLGAGILVSAGVLLLGFAYASESRAAAATPVAAPAAPSVIVYDQPNFKGQALTIAAATPDLATLKFDDKIASLSISGGGDWVLCENKNYTGRCVRVQSQADNLNLLQLGGRVSSLYPVPAAPATPATP